VCPIDSLKSIWSRRILKYFVCILKRDYISVHKRPNINNGTKVTQLGIVDNSTKTKSKNVNSRLEKHGTWKKRKYLNFQKQSRYLLDYHKFDVLTVKHDNSKFVVL
jgi:hypothetical protein